jgi:hypothetical protein
MSRPKKESYASDEDLSWFKLSNYAGLRDAPLALWATVVRDRVELTRFIDAGLKEEIAPQFEKIKVAPLSHLGFAKRYAGAEHQSNTPTVKLITMNRLAWLYDAMLRNEAEPRTVVDECLATDPESLFTDYAHLMVNIHATESQLEADFKAWLQKWRKHVSAGVGGSYETKTDSWAKAAVVPSMDLELFSKLTGKNISISKKFEMLLPAGTAIEHESQRKRLSEMRKAIFTDEMAQLLQHLSQQTTSPKPE